MLQLIRHVRTVSFLLALVLIGSAPPIATAAGSDEKPNIVLVLMDNFGWGEIGVYGGGVMRGAPTPNIDGIATEDSS